MLTLPPAVRIYFATTPIDMRCSFRGLSGAVRQRLAEDPLSGHLFCFTNKNRTLLKVLFYDRTGYAIFYKRLSKGTFQIPTVEPGQAAARIHAGQLALILEGLDLRGVKQRLRYRHDPHTNPPTPT